MEGIEGLVVGDIGPEGKVFVPLILMVAIFVGLSNLIGVAWCLFANPDLTTTLTLAGLVFVVGHVAAIMKKGFCRG